ncbi:Uncharacterized protein Rs2_25656 [Raphanus sativus]|uniref:Uncharacterized protein LOC108810013 n=1 Tax=Raphanus sativus TaxID=3726 RepID=A0A6J0JQ07_RAPSA|nr:uncharacterized protein LOC108810013 [Raphanus sativus]KAJ4885908.1 Uncharacterized protein Rs2_25656 [Raphanus sativus]
MGNCIVVEKKVIKIMRNDGEVVEYRGPMHVHDILTQFSGHYSLFDSLSNSYHLHPQAKLLCGRLYYLMPKKTTTIKNKKTKKEVRFANPEVEKEEGDILTYYGDNTKEKSPSVVRVKMVVSKQELEKLLQGGPVHEMVYRSLAKQHMCHDDDDDAECLRGWRPLLDSIPESD